uniref:Uncharacterized protein n=1 Tax=Strombidium inclinatum TaxID=197538 RepID=A0A7S3IP98_9SPIT
MVLFFLFSRFFLHQLQIVLNELQLIDASTQLLYGRRWVDGFEDSFRLALAIFCLVQHFEPQTVLFFTLLDLFFPSHFLFFQFLAEEILPRNLGLLFRAEDFLEDLEGGRPFEVVVKLFEREDLSIVEEGFKLLLGHCLRLLIVTVANFKYLFLLVGLVPLGSYQLPGLTTSDFRILERLSHEQVRPLQAEGLRF